MTVHGVARLVLALGLAFVAAVPGGAAAQVGEHIARYDVDVDVARDGRIHVTETIDYVFFSPRHGIERRIPVRASRPDGRVRVYPLSGVRVTGSAATPVGTRVSDDGDYRVVRIGDPDRTIVGKHTYVIAYTVSGALTRYEGHDELSWDAVGDQWRVSIFAVSVRVRAAEPVTAARCFAGPAGSTERCESAAVARAMATYRHPELPRGSGVTVVAALPHGYAASVGPLLRRRGEVHPTFAYAGRPLYAALAVLLAGCGLVVLLLRLGRDVAYAGQIPGLAPGAGDDARVATVRPFADRTGAIEWQPPEGVHPALAGVLLDQRFRASHVSATIADLAVRGHLRLERLDLPGEDEWRLHRLDGGDELTPYERHVLGAVFNDANATIVTALRARFGYDLPGIADRLWAEVEALGLFRERPDELRTRWLKRGLLALLAAVVTAVVVSVATRYDLVAWALVPPVLLLLALRGRLAVRTAQGSAALARVLGFRRYLKTAEADEISARDRAGEFARYLPYAMVFGQQTRWARTLGQLGVTPAGVEWVSGATTFDDLAFRLSTFASGTNAGSSSSSDSTSSSSSDSSGFSDSGSSGSGGGGGGGSSW